MARVDPVELNSTTEEDLDVYRDVDVSEEGFLESDDYEVVVIWGTEHDNTDRATGSKTGTVRWGLMLGFTIGGDPPVKGFGWFNVSQDSAQRWKNMLRILDPELFTAAGVKEVKPSDYAGMKAKVRLGYGGEGYEDKLFLQRFMKSGTNAPKRSAPAPDEISDDDLPF